MLRTHRALVASEQRIAQLVDDDQVMTRLATVAGKPTSLVLTTTQGSPLNFPDPPSYLKAMVLNLKVHSSGKYHRLLKITKRGPAKPHRYLYFAVLRWSHTDPVITAWYQRMINSVYRIGLEFFARARGVKRYNIFILKAMTG